MQSAVSVASSDVARPSPLDHAPAAPRRPFCVDLDGTLLRTDSLIESLLALATSLRLGTTLGVLLRSGRAAFKRAVSEQVALDVATLPYNEAVLDLARAAKASGCRVVLATAADARIADAVAAHLGLFDEVIASDGRNNLKGAAKAAALVARFGSKGFDYCGDSSSDLPVWREAADAIVVNASSGTLAAARQVANVTEVIDERPSTLREIGRALRLYQWVKNILVFVPLFTAHAFFEPMAWRGAILAFIAFSLTASSIYLVNDLLDLTADRRHPRKRHRPFASGRLPLQYGPPLFAGLLACGIATAVASGAVIPLIAYALTSTAYSLYLKRKPLVDVFALAFLYTVRLFAGGEAALHPVSLWLLGFSSFLFLSLGLVKRVEELTVNGRRQDKKVTGIGTAEKIAGRGYTADDAVILQLFGCCAAFASVIVLALFVQAEALGKTYASPGLLWGIVPLILFWQCRLWLSTARGNMHDDPIVFAARDWVSWIVGGVLVVVVLAAKSPLLAG